MKIGIITQRIGRNYGGTIQNYALQTILKRLGHDPVTLMLNRPKPSFIRTFIHAVVDPILRLVGKNVPLFFSTKVADLIYSRTQKFVDENICIVYLNKKDFRKYAVNQCLEAFVVGSDQVWRPKYNDSLEISFLGFVEDLKLKKIAYAASFGVDEWEYNDNETLRCSKLAAKFDDISVREASAVELCKKYLSVDSIHVLDPTMLLSKEDYCKLLKREKYYASKSLFAYLLDDNIEKRTIIEQIALKRGLKVVYFMPQKLYSNLQNAAEIPDATYRPIEEWLAGFNECEYVVCDSFHGSVFSIIFNKPFTIIENSNRGNTRFDSLLNLFHLEDRMYNSKNIDKIDLIDWNDINRIIEYNKQKSLSFLRDNLCGKLS